MGSFRSVYKPIPPNLFLIDSGPFSSADAHGPGIYLAGYSNGPVRSANVSVYMSRDGGATYHSFAELGNRATWGNLDGTDKLTVGGTDISSSSADGGVGTNFLKIKSLNLGVGGLDS